MNGSGWDFHMTNCTVSGNSASVGSSVHSGSSWLTLRNTILANPTSGGNCSGSMWNDGNNLDSGSSCGFGSATGSFSNTEARLRPLGNYGGKTKTFALIPGSPAVDGVTNDPTDYPPLDQREVTRPINGNFDGSALADIGAVEMGPVVALPLIVR